MEVSRSSGIKILINALGSINTFTVIKVGTWLDWKLRKWLLMAVAILSFITAYIVYRAFSVPLLPLLLRIVVNIYEKMHVIKRGINIVTMMRVKVRFSSWFDNYLVLIYLYNVSKYSFFPKIFSSRL